MTRTSKTTTTRKGIRHAEPGLTTAYVHRTKMIGGGTGYDVYFRCADKPSRPLHGSEYATVVLIDGVEHYRVYDAIDPKARWSLRAGLDKWDTHLRHQRIARRLEVRIAKRACPELAGADRIPAVWAPWTLPSAVFEVPVRLHLPE